MANKLPAIQFYPGDWKRDAGVQALDYETRGIWFEILLLMWESEQRGKLLLNGRPMPEEALARVLGLDVAKTQQALSKILAYGVASTCQETGALVNRRMLRDEQLRITRAKAGQLGGKQKADNAASKGLANSTPSSSSSSSISTSKQNKKDASAPKESRVVPENCIALAQLLAGGIQKNNPEAKVSIEGWSREADLMMRIDGRAEGQIRAAINWSQSDFSANGSWKGWASVILSMGALRKNFDKITAQMSAPRNQPSNGGGPRKIGNSAADFMTDIERARGRGGVVVQ